MSSNPNCEVCAGDGYVFGTDDNSQNGTVIQRCDTCATFDGDEAAARWVSSQIKSLPAELARQRDEIARLRAALVSLLDCSALNEDDNEDSLPAIEAARAALGDR